MKPDYVEIIMKTIDEIIEKSRVRKIYIAGPITRDPDNYKEKFRQAKEFLIYQGYDVISPAEYPDWINDYNSYINMGLKDLMECDAICMLPNWTASKGACLEHHYAEVTGKPIIYM